MTNTPTLDDRVKLASELLDNHHNDWDGSSTSDEIVRARYTVVVERDNDSWVRAADSVRDVARIVLDCYTGTDGYDEYVTEVYDMRTCEEVERDAVVKVTLTINEETAEVEDKV